MTHGEHNILPHGMEALDLPLIESYFPEYPKEIRSRLGRSGGRSHGQSVALQKASSAPHRSTLVTR